MGDRLPIANNPWPPWNLILCPSVEDQVRADERLPILAELAMQGWRTAVGLEPLLGPVDLSRWLSPWRCVACSEWYTDAEGFLMRGECDCHGPLQHFPQLIEWAAIGGETGPGARPCDVAWIRDLIRQADDAGECQVWVKALGENAVSLAGPARCQACAASSLCWCPEHRLLLTDRRGANIDEWPADLRRRERP